MAAITLTEGTDNITSIITKEDKLNTDILKITLDPTISIDAGDTVTYKDSNSTTIFTGIVENYKFKGSKSVEVYDNGAELLHTTVNKIYTNQSPEAIISDVITTKTSLTYVSTISSGLTIASYVVKDKKSWDVVSEMAEVLIANFRVDKNSNFQLELEGSNASSKNIDTNNAKLISPWNKDISQLVNKVIIVGDKQVFSNEQLFSGDGTTTVFTLNEAPIDIKVEHPLGTILTGYVADTGSGDYQIDRENMKITFDTAPVSGTNNIKMKYSYEVPIKVTSQNASSISTYGTREKKFEKKYIKSMSEARKYSKFILDTYSSPLLSSTWAITNQTDILDWENFTPNETIYVNDTFNGITGNFVIRKVERKYPGELRVTVGTLQEDLTFWNKEIQTRVKQLEEKDDNSTILQDYSFLEEGAKLTATVSITRYQERDIGNALYYDVSRNYDAGYIYDGMGTWNNI